MSIAQIIFTMWSLRRLIYHQHIRWEKQNLGKVRIITGTQNSTFKELFLKYTNSTLRSIDARLLHVVATVLCKVKTKWLYAYFPSFLEIDCVDQFALSLLVKTFDAGIPVVTIRNWYKVSDDVKPVPNFILKTEFHIEILSCVFYFMEFQLFHILWSWLKKITHF